MVKSHLLIILAAIGCLAVLGCSKNPEGTASVPSSIALNWKAEPEFGGLYEAQRAGLFYNRGVKMEITGGPGAPVIQMIAAGKAAFGIASADEVVIARARGSDIVAIFATYQTSPQGLMAHASRGFHEIADVFRGGTLAVEPGLPYVKYLEKKFGFSKIRVVPYSYSIAPFITDKQLSQQCFITSEPIAARRLGGDPQVFLVADAGYNPYTAVVVTSGNILRTRRTLVLMIIESLREGWEKYLSNPDPADQVMSKLNTEMDLATFKAAAEAQKKLILGAHGTRVGTMTADRWSQLAKQLAELKVISQEPRAEDCFIQASESAR